MLFDEGNGWCALERNRAALSTPCLVAMEGRLIHIAKRRVIADGEDDQLPYLGGAFPEQLHSLCEHGARHLELAVWPS